MIKGRDCFFCSPALFTSAFLYCLGVVARKRKEKDEKKKLNRTQPKQHEVENPCSVGKVHGTNLYI